MEGATNPLDVTLDEGGQTAEEAKSTTNGRNTNGGAVSSGALPSKELADDDDDPPTGCGGLGFYPAPLQRLASRHVFILFFCLKNVFQAMVFTYLIGVQTSIERHFHFSSQQTGFLPSIGELGPLLSSVFLSYLASHGNRPRWMGIGMGIVTCGLLLGFVSYLVVPAPEIRDNTAESRRLCVETELRLLSSADGTGPEYGLNDTRSCTIDSSGSNIGYLLWSLMYIMCASGAQTIFVVSAPYMDDGVSQKDSPLFFAVAGAARVIGPILGYMLASSCISVYVNPSVDPGITEKDQRRIVSLSLFDRCSYLSPEFVTRITGLLKNVILMSSTFSVMFFLIAILGFFTYQPKYLEHQFRVDKATATTYSAISKVTLVFGTIGSGFLMRRYRPNARLVTGTIVVVRLVATGVFLCNLAVTCGVADDLPGLRTSDGSLDISPSCSTSCHCTTEEYIPVCHRSGDVSQSYFSPCHAGCLTAVNHTEGPPTYTDCRCLEEPSVELTSGLCEGSCDTQFHTYLVITALTGLISSLVSIPHLMVTLRCVKPEDKALGLGLNGAFIAVAFGLGPMVVGNLVDSTCLVWEQSCGETGACWVYDPDTFRHSLIWFHTVFYLLSVICDFVIFLNSSSLKLYLDEDSKKAKAAQNGEPTQNGVELTQKPGV
ncbi:Solute carrier organic anion transporter family member 1A6 [Amphibalanus amphitrite]|uniref:Solute carrier organic anion transporter family member 1A6 n=1 Tax=Amphibalanus amphitrite TaxID=1232801 RepID=A0A6A4VS76_AMPAM|nr:Solute carrier organic anion transporter family member 1A6 [Amphibalanus amphitrite]